MYKIKGNFTRGIACIFSIFLIFLILKCIHKSYWIYRCALYEQVSHKLIYVDTTANIVIHPFFDGEKLNVVIPKFCDGCNVCKISKERLNISESFIVDTANIIISSIDLPAMFVTINDYDYASIDKNKKHKSKAKVQLFNTKGNLIFESESSSIHGRGSSSWDYPSKKSYSLKLDHNLIIGKLEGCKLCLLSNFYDPTFLKNKIVCDFSNTIGIPNAICSEFINLWINGDFRGLYLLVNKVGDYINYSTSYSSEVLLHIEQSDNVQKYEGVGFMSKNGQPVYFAVPKKPTEIQYSLISNRFDIIESVLSDSSSSQTIVNSVIDIESWVKYYLCQEAFLNVDAGRRSLYMSLECSDSCKLVAGQLWDFDYSMSAWGNRHSWPQSPLELYVSTGRGIETYSQGYPGLLSSMYKYDFFKHRVKIEYSDSFSRRLHNLFETSYYDSIVSVLDISSRLDKQRWAPMCNYTYYESCDSLRVFMIKRVNFLDSIWSK